MTQDNTTDATKPTERKPKMSRGWRAVLVASLALNLAVVGLVSGDGCVCPHDGFFDLADGCGFFWRAWAVRVDGECEDAARAADGFVLLDLLRCGRVMGEVVVDDVFVHFLDRINGMTWIFPCCVF